MGPLSYMPSVDRNVVMRRIAVFIFNFWKKSFVTICAFHSADGIFEQPAGPSASQCLLVSFVDRTELNWMELSGSSGQC